MIRFIFFVEKDVIESLNFYNTTATKPSNLSQKRCQKLLHKGRKYYNYKNKQAVKTLQVTQHVREQCPSSPQRTKYKDPLKRDTQQKQGKYSELFKAKPNLLAMKDLAQPETTLLRRPRVPIIHDIFHRDMMTSVKGDAEIWTRSVDHYKIPQVCVGKDNMPTFQESHLDFEDELDEYIKYFDYFRKNSLTTFFDPKPFTPDSYYAQNYPLLMQTVPRRHKRMVEIDVPNPSKMMSLTFFNDLSGLPVKTLSDVTNADTVVSQDQLSLTNTRIRFRRRSAAPRISSASRSPSTLPPSNPPPKTPSPLSVSPSVTSCSPKTPSQSPAALTLSPDHVTPPPRSPTPRPESSPRSPSP